MSVATDVGGLFAVGTAKETANVAPNKPVSFGDLGTCCLACLCPPVVYGQTKQSATGSDGCFGCANIGVLGSRIEQNNI